LPWLRRLRSEALRWGYTTWVARRLELPVEAVATEVGSPTPSTQRPQPPRPEATSAEGALGLALISPEAASMLAEAGALEELGGELGRVGQAIKEMVDEGLEVSPAAVMDRLEDPRLHELVARIVQATPTLAPEDAARLASGIIEQLNRRRLLKMRKKLNRQIAEAEQRGDYELVARLQQRRRELSGNHLPTTTGEG